MNGYTKGARNELFALRPAPIQVKFICPFFVDNRCTSFTILQFVTVYVCNLVYTEFILVQLHRNLLAYRKTLEFFPGTNQY